MPSSAWRWWGGLGLLVLSACQQPVPPSVQPSDPFTHPTKLAPDSGTAPKPLTTLLAQPSALTPADPQQPLAERVPVAKTQEPLELLPVSAGLSQAKQLILSLPALTTVGQPMQMGFKVLNAQGQELPGEFQLVWQSSRPEQLSVNKQGQVIAHTTAAQAEIRAALPGTPLHARLNVQFQATASVGSGGGGGGGGSAASSGGGSPVSSGNPQTEGHQPTVAGQAPAAATGNWLRWSDPQTWLQLGMRKPVAGDPVVIPAGQQVLLDESTPDLGAVTVNGVLRIDEARPLELQADYLMVHGRLEAGSEQQPFQGQFTLTLNDPNPEANSHAMMGTRGLFVMSGQLALFGRAPQTTWTRLNAHLPAGSAHLQVEASLGWQAGDQVVIAPTDFYGTAESERLQIASVTGQQVQLQQGPQQARWGQLQYLGPNGMSLNPTGFVPASDTPTVLDERAAVGNLSRNIVIQGANDSLWQQQGFGGQVMIMGNDSQIQIHGVEMRRMGQSGRMARYPLHFHLLSYDRNGVERPRGGLREIRNNAIWDSSNRCVTIHGTNDVLLDNNICYDIQGHAIFLEDAVERRNQITRNLVLKVRTPVRPLLDSDRPNFTRGPSGFWLTNPDNTVTGNLAADAVGNGFWMAFPAAPLGLNKQVPILPNRLPFGVFDDNISHSNGEVGIQLDWVPVNDAGETQPLSYAPTRDGLDHGYDFAFWERLALRRITTFKNRGSGFWNRTSWPNYERWVSADNLGVFFAGAGADGYISHSLVVGESLNNQHSWQNLRLMHQPAAGMAPPVAFASYHSTFNMQHNSVVNFPFVAGQPSGAFSTTDYYISAVDRGPVRNSHNQLINSHPGYRSPVRFEENWALAGALWDPHGYWGPAGNYWVYDNPFLTAELPCQPVAPAGQNGMSCQAEYFGVGDFQVDGSPRYTPRMPIEITRYSQQGQVLGTWAVGDGDLAPMLNHMRHFAVVRNGRYFLDFPGEPVPSRQVELSVGNAFRPEDQFLLGVRFSGAVSPQVAVSSRYSHGLRPLQVGNSLAEVEAGSGNLYWQDSQAQIVWVKLRHPAPFPPAPAGQELSDDYLYQDFRLHLLSP